MDGIFNVVYVPKYAIVSAVQTPHSRKLLPIEDKDLIGVVLLLVLKLCYKGRVDWGVRWPESSESEAKNKHGFIRE